jgi:putative hemolysin
MPSFLLEVFFILLLICANGAFAMSEIAVVSSRRARLQERAERGDSGARVALELVEDPSRFLSTVQVGITLVGILTGALGGATLSNEVAEFLGRIGILGGAEQATLRNFVAIALVVMVISYLSLVLGELVPKQLGLTAAERVAARVAKPMRLLSVLGHPLVRVLSASTNLVVKLLRIPPSTEPSVTEDEIKILLREGAVAGTFEETERLMVESIFRLADWRVGALMTPRTEIEWLDPQDSVEELVSTISNADHSHFPLAEDSLDNVIGMVHAKQLLIQCLSGKPLDLRALAQPPLYVPESMRVLRLLEQFRNMQTPVALVVDEYGSLEGLVTLSDVMAVIVRDVPTSTPHEEQLAVRREDGSWLVDGSMPVDEFKDLFNIRELPEEDAAYYQTVGGLVMMQLGRIPVAGEHFYWQNLRMEVVDMDGHRVDKVMVMPQALADPEPETPYDAED